MPPNSGSPDVRRPDAPGRGPPAGRPATDGPAAPGRGRQDALKVAAVLGFFAAWAILYDWLNHRGTDPARMIYGTRPLDRFPGIIQPWTAVVYVFGGLAMPLLPLAFHWTWPRLRRVLACYALTSLVAFVCYGLWPLGIVRPTYRGDGVGERLMRAVFAVDRPANCFPSGHAAFAVLGAILVDRGGAGRVTRGLTWALAIAVCATTVTTGQHYFLDVPGGAAAALLGYAAARRLWPAAGRAGSAAAAGQAREAAPGD